MREARRDDVLGNPSRRVGRRAVDLRAVLARERATTVAAHAAVRVDDDLAAGEARIAHRPAHDEAARGIDEDLRVAPGDAHGVEHRRDHMGAQVGLDDGHVLDLGIVLRGDDQSRDLGGDAVVVAHGHLRLPVGAQIRQRAVLAHLRQALGEPVREVDGHRHEHVRLVGGEPEHDALVARADTVEVVGIGARRSVDALRDVGALLVDHVDDAAGIAVEAVLRAVVADAAHHVARDLLNVDVGLRADLARDEDRARRDERLAGASHIVETRGHARRRDVPLGLETCLLCEDRIEHRIGDLVADLVGMALGHALRGEEEAGRCHDRLLSALRAQKERAPS